jgi:membrane-bound ClpP family serine protease
MLAYSCRFIGIVKDATMGAAEPVLAGEGGQMQSASEKINSALRADFANRAGFYERDPLIAEAMVDKDILLITRHAKVIRLSDEKEILPTDKVITAKGKLLTLDAKEMIEYGVADFQVDPKKLLPITEEEELAGKWPASKSLLFSHPFFEAIPGTVVDAFKMDWRLAFMAFLASPAVSSMLFLGLMLGFYMELNSPGFGLPGTVGIICLFFIVLSSFALEAVTWLEVIILLTGVILLGVELFIIPGFGFTGITGIILMIGALFALMLPSVSMVDFDFATETLNPAGEVFMERLAWLCGSFILGVIAIALLARYVMPRFYLFNRLVLAGEQNASEGFVAVDEQIVLPSAGEKGVVAATLRPAGKVWIDSELYDAVSSGHYLEKGTEVTVLYTEGSKIVVEEA